MIVRDWESVMSAQLTVQADTSGSGANMCSTSQAGICCVAKATIHADVFLLRAKSSGGSAFPDLNWRHVNILADQLLSNERFNGAIGDVSRNPSSAFLKQAVK